MASDRSESARGALRGIPSLDAFLRRPAIAALPRTTVTRVGREFLAEVRAQAGAGRLAAAAVKKLFSDGRADREVARRCEQDARLRHARVINATGVVLHTGLGRAPLCAPARAALAQAAGYAVVEVDWASGKRNQREEHVAALLAELTATKGALVVNNNAAAVNLALQALGAGREVVVSRGELVEIGGGFRMPEVMAAAGCKMVEVGTTNRTHLRDYEAVVGPATAILLRVHPSNFRILGFTAAPSLAELVDLGHRHGALVVDDLGSGLLLREPPPGLREEPTVHQSVAAGADLVCFSGDKLLGGPQCGILVGKQETVAKVRAHPMYRAFRCDKLTLAALEATLRVYRDGDPQADIPTLRMLAADPADLRARAEILRNKLARNKADVRPSESFAGSGSNPARPLPSFAVTLPGGEAAAAALRQAPVPIFARLDQERVWCDLRTLALEDLDEVASRIQAALARTHDDQG
jgi:L-seryl-tRNA(Ser) seleniumtransferase